MKYDVFLPEDNKTWILKHGVFYQVVMVVSTSVEWYVWVQDDSGKGKALSLVR